MQDGDIGADPVLDMPHQLSGVQAPHGATIRDYVLPPSAAEDAPVYGVGLKGAVATGANAVKKCILEGGFNGVRFSNLDV